MTEPGQALEGKDLKEEPSNYERENLGTHVEKCYLRYDMVTKSIEDLRRDINDDIGGVKRILWTVAIILIAGTISTNLALWIK